MVNGNQDKRESDFLKSQKDRDTRKDMRGKSSVNREENDEKI